MLQHRTNVLLSKDDYQLLKQTAEENQVSMGFLIRMAIAKVYGSASESETNLQAALIQKMKSVAGKSLQGLSQTDIKDMKQQGRA